MEAYMSGDRWMDKEDVVYKHNGLLLSHGEEWSNAMDATRDYHTKWSNPERESQMSYDVTHMWNLKYDTN